MINHDKKANDITGNSNNIKELITHMNSDVFNFNENLDKNRIEFVLNSLKENMKNSNIEKTYFTAVLIEKDTPPELKEKLENAHKTYTENIKECTLTKDDDKKGIFAMDLKVNNKPDSDNYKHEINIWSNSALNGDIDYTLIDF